MTTLGWVKVSLLPTLVDSSLAEGMTLSTQAGGKPHQILPRCYIPTWHTEESSTSKRLVQPWVPRCQSQWLTL